MVNIKKYIIGISLELIGIIILLIYLYPIIYPDLISSTYFLLSLSIILLFLGLCTILDFIKNYNIIIFGIIFVIFGLLEMINGLQNIVNFSNNFSDNIYLIELFLGGIYTLIGMIFIGMIFLPYLVMSISYILIPIIHRLRIITVKNILRNKRRSKNTFMMIALGLAFFLSVNTVICSIEAGIIPGAKLYLGCDLQLGELWNRDVYGYLNMTNDIRNINHITSICPVHITTIKLNDFMNISYPIYLFVINSTEYCKLNSDNIFMKINSPSGISNSQFIHLIDEINSTIVHTSLINDCKLKINDILNCSLNYKNISFKISGIFDRMPGLRFSFIEKWEASGLIISWRTFFNIFNLNSSTYDNYMGKRTVAFWIGLDNFYNDNEVIDILKNEIYPKIGVELDTDRISTIRTRVEEYSGIINVIKNTLLNILLFALIISIIGLSISMFISVHQRKREIGILRSIGISKYQILSLIFGETFIISICGIIFGVIMGLITGYLMIYYYPFIYFLPAIFTIDYVGIFFGIFLLLIFTLISAIIPAYMAIKINVIEALRFRG